MDKKVDSLFFDKFSLEELDMTGLLFQTGYLTIKSTRQRGYETFYYLNYPNVEVKKAFYHNLVQSDFSKKERNVENWEVEEWKRGV